MTALGVAIRACALAAGAAVVAGCAGHSTRAPAGAGAPPALLSAGEFALPADCPAVPGAVYRAEYVVTAGGEVEGVTRADGPDCVQSTLSDWVRTFRYAPGAAPASATVDWMLTVARR